jgi:hypothetical protein
MRKNMDTDGPSNQMTIARSLEKTMDRLIREALRMNPQADGDVLRRVVQVHDWFSFFFFIYGGEKTEKMLRWKRAGYPYGWHPTTDQSVLMQAVWAYERKALSFCQHS